MFDPASPRLRSSQVSDTYLLALAFANGGKIATSTAGSCSAQSGERTPLNCFAELVSNDKKKGPWGEGPICLGSLVV